MPGTGVLVVRRILPKRRTFLPVQSGDVVLLGFSVLPLYGSRKWLLCTST